MVKMSSNLADLLADLLLLVLTSNGEDEFKFGRSAPKSADLPPILTSSGEDEFKFCRSAGRSTPLVLTSSGQE